MINGCGDCKIQSSQLISAVMKEESPSKNQTPFA